MQLNNKINHSIIKIDKILIYENKIQYTVYEKNNGILLQKGVIEPDFLLIEKIKETVNLMEICYDNLALKINDFEFSNSDDLNWKVADRNVRVIIPIKLVNDSLVEMNDLGVILQSKITENSQTETNFIFNSENIIIAYFSQILDSDGLTLQPYLETEEIIIETK